MSWSKEVDKLKRRRDFALKMGGTERVAKQRERSKLKVRERIDAIADRGSFREFLGLTGTATNENGELKHVLPRAQVDGIAKIDARKVILKASDFTVSGFSGGSSSATPTQGQQPSASERAIEWRLPVIRLLDASGGSVKTFEPLRIVGGLAPDCPWF